MCSEQRASREPPFERAQQSGFQPGVGLASGQWAAEALLTGNPGEIYAAHVLDEAAPELARAARLKARFFRPAFTSLMMRALQQSEGIRAVMADLIAGRQTYAGLKSRLLRTFEWRLAARALLGTHG